MSWNRNISRARRCRPGWSGAAAGVRHIAAGWSRESPQYFRTPHSELKRRATPGTQGLSEAGHVTRSASPGCFVGKPHLVAIPQTSLQAPRTRCSQETNSVTSSGPSRPRELGVEFGSANAHIVDPPHEESTHGPNAEDVDRTAPVKSSGGTSAPHWGTSCAFCSSSSSPLGPSLVRKAASHSMHAPRDVGKVTHHKQSYSKPAVIQERVPLRLDHTVPAADLPSLAATSSGKEQFWHNN